MNRSQNLLLNGLATKFLFVATLMLSSKAVFAQGPGDPGGSGGVTMSPDYTAKVTSVTLTKTGSSSPWHLKGEGSFEIVVQPHTDPLKKFTFRATVELFEVGPPGTSLWDDERTGIEVLQGATKTFSMGNGDPGTSTDHSAAYQFLATIYAANATGHLDFDTADLSAW